MRYSIQHGNITTTAFRGQGGSRFEPQPKGYGMSQNHHFECPQATFDSIQNHFFSKKSNTRHPDFGKDLGFGIIWGGAELKSGLLFYFAFLVLELRSGK